MRISDWSSDVCSSDLKAHAPGLVIGSPDAIVSVAWTLLRRRTTRPRQTPSAKTMRHNRRADMSVRSALTILTFTAATALAGTALAQAVDAAAGAKVFNQCKACPTGDAGENKVRHSLHVILGRAPADVGGCQCHKAMER